MAKKGFGKHLCVDLWGCDEKVLSDLQLHFDFLNETPAQIGMTPITQPYCFPYKGLVPEDRGITGVIIIAESHISVHSFELKGYTFIDIFSCKPFDTEKTMTLIMDRFKPKFHEVKKMNRGKEFPR